MTRSSLFDSGAAARLRLESLIRASHEGNRAIWVMEIAFEAACRSATGQLKLQGDNDIVDIESTSPTLEAPLTRATLRDVSGLAVCAIGTILDPRAH